MDKKLTKEHKEKLAKDFGLELALVDSVIEVESSGSGFDPATGLIKIQFEPYWFKRFSGVKVANGVENQAQEWLAYRKASDINDEAAMLSTSWGLGQIMGFNYEAAGFNNVEEMLEKFTESEYWQLFGMLSFIKSNRKMYNGLKNHLWHVFAYYYNGEGYKAMKYDTKMEEVYKKHSKK